MDALAERCLTAIGCEVIQQDDGHAAGAVGDQRDRRADDGADRGAPAAVEFGGRGILLGGTPGVPPARIVVLGAGAVGFAAARTRRGGPARG